MSRRRAEMLLKKEARKMFLVAGTSILASLTIIISLAVYFIGQLENDLIGVAFFGFFTMMAVTGFLASVIIDYIQKKMKHLRFICQMGKVERKINS